MSYRYNVFTGNFDVVDPISIGDFVSGGTANSVLFIDSNQQVAENNPGLTYDGTIFRVSIDNGTNTTQKFFDVENTTKADGDVTSFTLSGASSFGGGTSDAFAFFRSTVLDWNFLNPYSKLEIGVAHAGSSGLGNAGQITLLGAASGNSSLVLESGTDLDMSDNAILDTGFIDFNLVNGVAQAEGRVVWNDTEGTLNLGMKGGIVNQQIGLEVMIRVKNTSGGNISNGQAVRITGASANVPEIGLADADDPAAAGSVGLATEDIDDGQFGYVTTFGLVRGDASQPINTSGFAAGDRVYVANTPGALTNVGPTSTERIIFIGIVLVSNNENGIIWVSTINTSYLSELSGNSFAGVAEGNLVKYNGANGLWENSTVQTIQLEPTGFPNRADTTTGFNDSTREFDITPTGATFAYWRRAKQIIKTGAQTVTIDDTTGTHFIYFDSNDDLVSSLTPWGFDDNIAFVATIYWRAGGSDYLSGEERHGLAMDWPTHQYLHDTVGISYESGLTGTFNDNNTATITAGEIHDEDIDHDISEQTTFRIIYRDGVSGTWFFDAASADYFKETADIIQYDNNGVLTDVPNGQHVAYWSFATNDPVDPIYMIVGQRVDATIANARANNTLGSLNLANLPSQEMKPIWRVIVKRTGTGETVEELTDLRTVSTLASGNFVAQDHGALGGLSDDDHPQYVLNDGESTDITNGTFNLTTTGSLTIDSDSNGLVLGDDQDATLKWDNLNSQVSLNQDFAMTAGKKIIYDAA